MKRFVAPLAVALAASAAHAQSFPILHTIDSNGTPANVALNAPGATFTTSFKASGDVVVTHVSGAAPSAIVNVNAFSTPNPNLLRSFVGSPANGTGSGLPGRFRMLEVPDAGLTTLRIDFARPLTVGDALLFADIDRSETIDIAAFRKVGNSFAPSLLTTWKVQSVAGQMLTTPTAQWAHLDLGAAFPAGRLIAGTASDIDNPGTMLWPDQPVDRIVLTARGGNSGNWRFTALSTGAPEPGTLGLLALGVAVAALRCVRSHEACS